jgi:FkbM family methyltransferase
MVVFDVGANIGYLSLLFARQAGPDGRVVAFEALPANLARLAAHIELNGMAPNITIVPAAVVDRPGPVDFLVHRSHGMGKAAGSAGRDEPERIESGTTIDLAQQAHPLPEAVKLTSKAAKFEPCRVCDPDARTDHLP